MVSKKKEGYVVDGMGGGMGSTKCRYSRGKVWLGDVSLHTRSVVVRSFLVGGLDAR